MATFELDELFFDVAWLDPSWVQDWWQKGRAWITPTCYPIAQWENTCYWAIAVNQTPPHLPFAQKIVFVEVSHTEKMIAFFEKTFGSLALEPSDEGVLSQSESSQELGRSGVSFNGPLENSSPMSLDPSDSGSSLPDGIIGLGLSESKPPDVSQKPEGLELIEMAPISAQSPTQAPEGLNLDYSSVTQQPEFTPPQNSPTEFPSTTPTQDTEDNEVSLHTFIQQRRHETHPTPEASISVIIPIMPPPPPYEGWILIENHWPKLIATKAHVPITPYEWEHAPDVRSPFSIVYKTQKPYHGLLPSVHPDLEKLFQSLWNQNQPLYLTVILKDQNFLLGWAQKERLNRNHLEAFESYGNKLFIPA